MTADFSMQLCDDATIADSSGDDDKGQAAVASTGNHEDKEDAAVAATGAMLQTRIDVPSTSSTTGGHAV